MGSFCYSHMKREEEEEEEPVSPTGQYFNSSVLSISVVAVLEFQVPWDNTLTIPLLKDVFLPINPRFSSIMVKDENGIKQWKKVEVKLEEHVHVPIFPIGLPPKSYDEYLNNFLSKIAMEQFPQSRPLWELYVINYPTSNNNAASSLIFKLHHALGDGYSLMGALLSCLHKADNDNPTLPLTFPNFQRRSSSKPEGDNNNNNNNKHYLLGFFNSVPRVFSSIYNTILDFGWSVLKSSLVEDEQSPIRSGNVGVEFSPINISTISFSLDHIKQIKSKLGVTLNDVITGVIFLGTRHYMQTMNHSSSSLQSTALVLLNTRDIGGYKSVEEMVNKPNNNVNRPLWGNQFCFLHISVPELNGVDDLNPIDFVLKAQKIIQRKKTSSGVHLTGLLLEAMRKYRGPEVTAKYVHSTLNNSSLTITNMMGPVEQMALANHLVKGLYFMVFGAPQSLVITMVSYMGELRVAVETERDHIDSQKFKSCIENAFNIMFKAACNLP